MQERRPQVDPRIPTSQKPKKKRSDLKDLMLGALAGLVGLLIIAAFMTYRDPHTYMSRTEQIREGCRREFGDDGSDAVQNCEFRLMGQEVIKLQQQEDQDQAEKLARAAR